MRRIWILLLTFALSAPLSADIPSPPGWKSETISMPPDFAPTMSWKGEEILRFAPGMFKAGEDDFFSYVFLLKLDQGEPDWDTQLLLYYQGLAKAVMEDEKLDTSSFELQLKGDSKVRYGTLDWIEPFTTKKPQRLNIEIRQISPQRWFFCASPADPYAPIWTSMRDMRNALENR